MPLPGILENRFCPLCGFQLEGDNFLETIEQSEEEYYLCLQGKHTAPCVVQEERHHEEWPVSFFVVWRADGAKIKSEKRWCLFCGFPTDECYTYIDFTAESQQKGCVFSVCSSVESHAWQEVHNETCIFFVEETLEKLALLEHMFMFLSWGLPN